MRCPNDAEVRKISQLCVDSEIIDATRNVENLPSTLEVTKFFSLSETPMRLSHSARGDRIRSATLWQLNAILVTVGVHWRRISGGPYENMSGCHNGDREGLTKILPIYFHFLRYPIRCFFRPINTLRGTSRVDCSKLAERRFVRSKYFAHELRTHKLRRPERLAIQGRKGRDTSGVESPYRACVSNGSHDQSICALVHS
jgi:hypothetical protein